MTNSPELLVTSWNVNEKRGNIESIEQLLDSLGNAPNQVICLQEVREDLLPQIDAMASARDMVAYCSRDKRRLQADGILRDCYLVTLTNLPVLQSDDWTMSHTSKRPPIARFTISALRSFKLWGDTTIENGALYVEVSFNNKRVRIINAHLSLTDPNTRKQEFETLLKEWQQGTPTIFCGDFNILEGVYGRIVNFLIGGSIPYALWRSERREFDELLQQVRLRNPLSDRKTHAAGQLDHILYGPGLLHGPWKRYNKLGSDHNPISAGFTMTQSQ